MAWLGKCAFQPESPGCVGEPVRKLLKDAEPSVRFRVSLALACAGDRKAVPVLIEALPHVTRDQAWLVLDVLYRLGGPTAPQLPPGDQVAARKSPRDACQAWWEEYGTMAEGTLLATDIAARRFLLRARTLSNGFRSGAVFSCSLFSFSLLGAALHDLGRASAISVAYSSAVMAPLVISSRITIPHAMRLNAMLTKNQIICCGTIMSPL